MTIRKPILLALCALALCSFRSANAQTSFTIRRPPDGATVREKVAIEIPRPSIKPGGFVAFYLDDKFHVALAPSDEPGSDRKPFTFVWDTKGSGAADGEHTIRAVLFEPAGSSPDSAAVVEKGSSEVKLTVANKIKNGPSSLLLRYKYRENENLEYNRDSSAVIVGGVSENGQTTSDQELNSVRSKLLLDIQDSRPAEDVALVRNKLVSLSLIQGNQETTLDPRQLSDSMYQELDSQGSVLYETGGASGLTEFMAQGLPVNNTLELPQLPPMRVSIGQEWRTPGRRIDIPGLPPALQPMGTFTNKLVGLEWEGGYQCAKIHQTYEGEPVKTVQFGPIEITQARIKYERDIFLAYKSGTLVKTTRALTVSGRTTNMEGMPASSAMTGGPRMGMMGGMMGAPGGSGMMGGPPPGAMAGMMAASGRGRSMSGFPGATSGFPGAGGGPPPGAMAGMMGNSGRGRGMYGQGGSGFPGGGRGRQSGRRSGKGGDDFGGGMMGSGMMGSGMMGGPGRMGMPGGSGMGIGRRAPSGTGSDTQAADRAITVKAITDTEIIRAKTAR